MVGLDLLQLQLLIHTGSFFGGAPVVRTLGGWGGL